MHFRSLQGNCVSHLLVLQPVRSSLSVISPLLDNFDPITIRILRVAHVSTQTFACTCGMKNRDKMQFESHNSHRGNAPKKCRINWRWREKQGPQTWAKARPFMVPSMGFFLKAAWVEYAKWSETQAETKVHTENAFKTTWISTSVLTVPRMFLRMSWRAVRLSVARHMRGVLTRNWGGRKPLQNLACVLSACVWRTHIHTHTHTHTHTHAHTRMHTQRRTHTRYTAALSTGRLWAHRKWVTYPHAFERLACLFHILHQETDMAEALSISLHKACVCVCKSTVYRIMYACICVYTRTHYIRTYMATQTHKHTHTHTHTQTTQVHKPTNPHTHIHIKTYKQRVHKYKLSALRVPILRAHKKWMTYTPIISSALHIPLSGARVYMQKQVKVCLFVCMFLMLYYQIHARIFSWVQASARIQMFENNFLCAYVYIYIHVHICMH